jgi:hypothetical protein
MMGKMQLSTRAVEVGGAGDRTIGISDDLEVTVGYDYDWNLWPPADFEPYDDEPPLTDAEKIEVCTIMIQRWHRLAAVIEARKAKDEP